jgi:hypothetical protein
MIAVGIDIERAVWRAVDDAMYRDVRLDVIYAVYRDVSGTVIEAVDGAVSAAVREVTHD